MLLKSFSKINLSLKVNRKQKKTGLHEIQTYFCLVDLYDQIIIKKINGKKDQIKFKGRFAKFVKKSGNSVKSTLEILRKNNLISNYYSITINKKIPVFGGMGGGSSNAASLIKYLVKKKVDKKLLNILSKKIGSDLLIFLNKQGFLSNLKKIIPFPKKYKLYFLLIYPNIKCSTRYIFSKVKKYSSKSKYNFKRINNKRKLMDFLYNQDNDLQSIVENQYPTIKKLILEIEQKKGCSYARMTGSGSICYGVFKSEKMAKAALSGIRLKHHQYWSCAAKTI